MHVHESSDQAAKKAMVIQNPDTAETQLMYTDSQLNSPSPISRFPDLGGDIPADLQMGGTSAEVPATAHDDSSSCGGEESPEEEEKTSDECIEPVTRHELQIIEIESECESALSPKKAAPMPPTGQGANLPGGSAALQGKPAESKGDSSIAEPQVVDPETKEEVRPFQEIEQVLGSDEEGKDTTKGVFKDCLDSCVLLKTHVNASWKKGTRCWWDVLLN